MKPPLVSVSQDSGSSSADHSGETVLEVDLAHNTRASRSPATRKVSMTEPTRRLSAINPALSRDRSPSPFRLGRRGSRSPCRSREWEEEVPGKRWSSGVAQQQQQRTSTRKREQWARSVRAKTMSARSSLFSVESEPYPVHPLLRSTRSTSPRPSLSGSSSRSSITPCF